jgi:hypothetical protein
MVKTGEIAATVLIAGKPTGSFGKFKMEPGMTLLPVPYTEALEQDYLPAKLTNDDYPNLIPKGSSVDTVAIPSVLAVYNWPRDTDRYRRVSLFIDAFFTKFPEFQKAPRHIKWKETNLSATLRGWKRFPAARSGWPRPRRNHRRRPRRSPSTRPSCARRLPRPRPTTRPSRTVSISSSWSGAGRSKNNKTAQPGLVGRLKAS